MNNSNLPPIVPTSPALQKPFAASQNNVQDAAPPKQALADMPAVTIATPVAQAAPSLAMSSGSSLPPSRAVPQLLPQQMLPADDIAAGHSAIAQGISFKGRATVASGCMIGGEWVGNIDQAPGKQVHITVTISGRVTGDVQAHQISVLGSTNGLIDASEGQVTLHESASVHGHVRYAKLQVNGADLNATLEKFTTKKHDA